MSKQTAVQTEEATKKPRFKVIALDHGNVWVKGYAGEDKTLLLPNQYLKKDLTASQGLFKSKLILNEYKSNKYQDEVFQWGQDVYKGLEPYSTYTSEDRYIQKPYRVLTEIALTELAEDGDSIFVITGVPSKQKGTKSETDLIKAFEGAHIVTRNGNDVVLKVVDTEILTQPLGTVMYLYLDDEGNIVDKELEDDYVGIIDIGGGTLDLDGVRGLETIMDDRETIDTGLYKIYQKISDYVNRENPNAGATAKLVEFQVLGDNPDAYKVSKRSVVDIAKIKEELFREFAERVIPQINARWTNRSKFDRIVLTGGGSKPLAKYFKEWEKDIIVIDEKDSQMANVMGFYRYGVAISKEE